MTDILDNIIYKKNDESFDEYKIRLCQNKQKYGLYWYQIADLLNDASGNNFGESFYRKWWKNYCGNCNGLDSKDFISDKTDEIDLKITQLQKEKIKFYDQRRAYNKIIREQSRREDLLEIIEKKLSCITPYNYCVKKTDISSNNDLLVGLNDIHYGIDINNYWNIYNPEIAKERLDKYLGKIISIKELHKSENCYVCANGDFISGNIHKSIQVSNKENVVEQIMHVSELISGFLYELSKHFNNVYFVSVAGNHSRIDKKDDALKDEKLDRLVPWYIQTRMSTILNIKVLDSSVDSTMNLVNIRGLYYLNVHGDYDDWNNISKTIKMLNQNVYCVHFGHKHHNATDYIQGYKVIMSGSLMGMDDFCIEKRIYGKAQQMVAVCTSDGILCTYDIDLQ